MSRPSQKKGSAFTNWQERAKEFKVGDKVFPFYSDAYRSGTVVAVWPAIGFVDVQYPHGATRQCVTELHRIGPVDETLPIETESVPGGAWTVPVDAGPFTEKVARAYVKKALYWAAVDRRYRATREELDGGRYSCPRCRMGPLRKAVYKRRDGFSEKLYGCPQCLFLIKREDILGEEC